MRDMDNRLGTHTDKVYDDYKDVNEIVHLPDDAIHRNVDKIVLSAGTQNADSVKTAIVCAPTIYGKGRGPGNIRSVQAYELAKTILTKQIIPVVGQGQTIWNGIHVADLADLFVLLTEAAVTRKLDTELWGAHGYYFAENGEFLWADLARLMGQKAEELGMTGSLKEQQFDMASATEFAGFVAISWGVNSRCKAERARKLLGWAPSRLSVEDTVPEILRGEKVALV
jgi:nucleoside-diphosphate-sugar epimerase